VSTRESFGKELIFVYFRAYFRVRMIWFPLSKGFTKEARIKLQAFFCILLKNSLY
jgi:hypothetical protein